MVRPGDLTASGMLYEGSDFEEWKRRVTAMASIRSGSHHSLAKPGSHALEFTFEEVTNLAKTANELVHEVRDAGLSTDSVFKQRFEYIVSEADSNPRRTVRVAVHGATQRFPDQIQPVVFRPQLLPLSRKPEEIRALQAACDHISSTLLDRIPTSMTGTSVSFWRDLPRFAQPFRLLDLPEDVRNRIYKIVFAEGACFISGTVPALLLTSKQVRAEAQPSFFAFSNFLLIANPFSKQAITKCLSSWLQLVVRDHSKYLRKLSLSVFARRPGYCAMLQISVTFVYHDSTGLVHYVNSELTQPSREMLLVHTRSIEEMRQVMGLRGEAVSMAILSRPDLWQNGALELKGRPQTPVMPTGLTSSTQPPPNHPQTSSSNIKFPIPKSLLPSGAKGGNYQLQRVASTRR